MGSTSGWSVSADRWRGEATASSNNTRAPRRAAAMAVAVPAGPAPTTSTSQAVRSPMSVYPNETSATGPVSRTLSMSAIDLPPRAVGDVPVHDVKAACGWQNFPLACREECRPVGVYHGAGSTARAPSEAAWAPTGGGWVGLLCCGPAIGRPSLSTMDCSESGRTVVPAQEAPAERSVPAWRALVDRCRDGDERAWAEFHTAFNALAHRRLRRHFHQLGPNDRADLAAATLERLIVAVRGGHIRGVTDLEVGAYISRALRNQALDLVSRRHPEVHIEGLTAQPAQDGGAFQRVLISQIMAIVASWSPSDRLVFLQKSHGVRSERIKAELEQSPYSEFIDVATVDTRYLRLRSRLRSQLEC